MVRARQYQHTQREVRPSRREKKKTEGRKTGQERKTETEKADSTISGDRSSPGGSAIVAATAEDISPLRLFSVALQSSQNRARSSSTALTRLASQRQIPRAVDHSFLAGTRKKLEKPLRKVIGRKQRPRLCNSGRVNANETRAGLQQALCLLPILRTRSGPSFLKAWRFGEGSQNGAGRCFAGQSSGWVAVAFFFFPVLEKRGTKARRTGRLRAF
jgi:hypothetical protein